MVNVGGVVYVGGGGGCGNLTTLSTVIFAPLAIPLCVSGTVSRQR